MKKVISLVLTLTIIFALLLSGCGKHDFTGVYSFRMGKVDSQHFSVTINLTDEDYTGDDEVVNAKKFSLVFDVFSMMEGGNILPSDEGGLGEEVEKLALTALMTYFKDGIKINGYYKLGEEFVDEHKGSKGTRLLLGFSISKTIEDLINYIEGKNINLEKADAIFKEYLDFSILDIKNSILKLENNIIEMLVYAFVKDNSLTMRIPVSSDDLLYQLYWYGKYIDLSSGSVYDVTPHEIGSFPTAEEVTQIQQEYPDFRIFYTLDLALIKE